MLSLSGPSATSAASNPRRSNTALSERFREQLRHPLLPASQVEIGVPLLRLLRSLSRLRYGPVTTCVVWGFLWFDNGQMRTRRPGTREVDATREKKGSCPRVVCHGDSFHGGEC